MKKIIIIYLFLQVSFSFSQSLSQFIAKGDSCLNLKNTNSAIQYYTQAINLDPKNSICLYKRGKIYVEYGFYNEAIQDLYNVSLLRIAQKDEVLESTFYLLGECYSKLNQQEKAIEKYSNAIMLNPKNPTFYRARFDSYLKLTKHKEALEDLKRHKKYTNSKSEYYFLTGEYNLAIKNYSKSYTYYTKAILLEPTKDLFYLQRGKLLAIQDKYEDAILNFSKAIELDSENDEALLQRGLAYHRVNNILAGCSDFRLAAYLGNDEARVMLEAHCPH